MIAVIICSIFGIGAYLSLYRYFKTTSWKYKGKGDPEFAIAGLVISGAPFLIWNLVVMFNWTGDELAFGFLGTQLWMLAAFVACHLSTHGSLHVYRTFRDRKKSNVIRSKADTLIKKLKKAKMSRLAKHIKTISCAFLPSLERREKRLAEDLSDVNTQLAKYKDEMDSRGETIRALFERASSTRDHLSRLLAHTRSLIRDCEAFVELTEAEVIMLSYGTTELEEIHSQFATLQRSVQEMDRNDRMAEVEIEAAVGAGANQSGRIRVTA